MAQDARTGLLEIDGRAAARPEDEESLLDCDGDKETGPESTQDNKRGHHGQASDASERSPSCLARPCFLPGVIALFVAGLVWSFIGGAAWMHYHDTEQSDPASGEVGTIRPQRLESTTPPQKAGAVTLAHHKDAGHADRPQGKVGTVAEHRSEPKTATQIPGHLRDQRFAHLERSSPLVTHPPASGSHLVSSTSAASSSPRPQQVPPPAPEQPKFGFHFSLGDWHIGVSTTEIRSEVAHWFPTTLMRQTTTWIPPGQGTSRPLHARGPSPNVTFPPLPSANGQLQDVYTTTPRLRPSSSQKRHALPSTTVPSTTVPSTTVRQSAATTVTPSTAPHGGVADCISDQDWSIWRRGGKSRFDEEMTHCASKCFGGSSCVKDCLVRRQGYTGQCAQCGGDLAGCTKDNCLWQCMGGASDGCTSCVQEKCQQGFEKCSGIDLDAAP